MFVSLAPGQQAPEPPSAPPTGPSAAVSDDIDWDAIGEEDLPEATSSAPESSAGAQRRRVILDDDDLEEEEEEPLRRKGPVENPVPEAEARVEEQVPLKPAGTDSAKEPVKEADKSSAPEQSANPPSRKRPFSSAFRKSSM